MKYDHLLSNTNSMMNQVYWFQQDIKLPKAASHRGVSIRHVDIKEMRSSFIRELKSTALNWVYSSNKYKTLFEEEMLSRNGDAQNACSYLMQVADQKFRKGNPQGQYGELLLFNFIQHFFRAPPLLRKMPITTNPSLERNGADAIHYREDAAEQCFILGESKCYESKYRFNEALQVSIDSIVTSFENLENELILYQFDDFIDPELIDVAKNLKDGKLTSPKFELVCLIIYEENRDISANSQTEIQNKIEECLKYRWANTHKDLYKNVGDPIVSRIHYVVFPNWSLRELLDEF
ncbi:HamA C-terminal domain-containing protein [Cellvibrio sp. ARAG 10.3]|uniref:HamA C-terminal domain-containing protein n=1 Tax=Cellvibrio sp. ARAG 10.3 TaxID=3451358 RepID=UPI003F449C5F